MSFYNIDSSKFRMLYLLQSVYGYVDQNTVIDISVLHVNIYF